MKVTKVNSKLLKVIKQAEKLCVSNSLDTEWLEDLTPLAGLNMKTYVSLMNLLLS